MRDAQARALGWLLTMLVALIVALAFWFCAPSFAAGPCAPAVPPLCLSHACSNDALNPVVAGDELMCWDNSPGTTEVRVYHGPHLCATLKRQWSARASRWVPPPNWWRPYSSTNPECWPPFGFNALYHLVACNCSDQGLPCGCSEPGPVIEFRGLSYCCFSGAGEFACEAGRPLCFGGSP
jgi:hypothetical protein